MSSAERRSCNWRYVVDFWRLHLKAVDVVNVFLLLLMIRGSAVRGGCYTNYARSLESRKSRMHQVVY